ncbi:hypothetical protein L1887_32591 [Cichorium endivia]|nr:hypothetical protein L1887_32591 [Cichorium endivia]
MDASFPRGFWPPKLCSLTIGGLKKPISKWGPQTFPTSLVELVLIGGESEDVSNFSRLSHLLPSSLTFLRIQEFEKVESVSMGLQHLTSLRSYKLNLKTSASRNSQVPDLCICFSKSSQIKLQGVIHMVFFTASELYLKHFHFIFNSFPINRVSCHLFNFFLVSSFSYLFLFSLYMLIYEETDHEYHSMAQKLALILI